MKIFELLKDTKNLIIFAITCTVVCIVGRYRNFDFVEIGAFKLSFDFMFFVALVGATVSSLMLIGRLLSFFLSWIKGIFILKNLKNCTLKEKAFLHNRMYENGNRRQIDIFHDSYFYKQDEDATGYKLILYKKEFKTPQKVGKFLYDLEKKQILKYGGEESMIISPLAWKILRKYAKEIFADIETKDFNG